MAVYGTELYITDTGNNRIRKVDGSGTITTIAGTGVANYSGDNGLATSATFNTPLGIAEGTVKMHLHTIYEKLAISGRVELSIYAREHAIV